MLSPWFIYEGDVLFDKAKKRLISFRSKSSTYIIPDGVTQIGDGAFYGCSSLVNITIPDSVTRIGDSAFYGCTSLVNITIPSSVIQVGKGAFFVVKPWIIKTKAK